MELESVVRYEYSFAFPVRHQSFWLHLLCFPFFSPAAFLPSLLSAKAPCVCFPKSLLFPLLVCLLCVPVPQCVSLWFCGSTVIWDGGCPSLYCCLFDPSYKSYHQTVKFLDGPVGILWGIVLKFFFTRLGRIVSFMWLSFIPLVLSSNNGPTSPYGFPHHVKVECSCETFH